MREPEKAKRKTQKVKKQESKRDIHWFDDVPDALGGLASARTGPARVEAVALDLAPLALWSFYRPGTIIRCVLSSCSFGVCIVYRVSCTVFVCRVGVGVS